MTLKIHQNLVHPSADGKMPSLFECAAKIHQRISYLLGITMGSRAKFMCNLTTILLPIKKIVSITVSCIIAFSSVFLQIQKRSGAWFFKGRDQQGLPPPLPLSRPQQSSVENSSAPGGHHGSQEPTHHQQYGSVVFIVHILLTY